MTVSDSEIARRYGTKIERDRPTVMRWFPAIGEPAEWAGPRTFRFQRRAKPDDPSARGKYTGRVVSSRAEGEDLIITQGVYAARPAVRFAKVASLYRAALHERRPGVVRWLDDALEHLRRHLPDIDAVPFGLLDDAHVLIFRRGLEAETLDDEVDANGEPQKRFSPPTIVGYLCALRGMCNWATLQHFSDRDPVSPQIEAVGYTRKRRVAEVPMVDELRPMRQAADAEGRALFDLGLSTAEAPEVLAARWIDLDLPGEAIFLRAPERSDDGMVHGRWAALSPQALASLCELRLERMLQGRAGEDRIFGSWNDPGRVVREFDRIQVAHGLLQGSISTAQAAVFLHHAVERLSRLPHSFAQLRMAAGRAAAEAGASVYALGNMLGLQTVRTVRRRLLSHLAQNGFETRKRRAGEFEWPEGMFSLDEPAPSAESVEANDEKGAPDGLAA